MHPVRRLMIAVVLLGAGYFGVQLVRESVPGEDAWEAQLQADADTAIQVLHPGLGPETLPQEFWDRWDLQLEPYDAERRAELSRRLHLYLDFLEAEYAEAAEIYTAGVEPERRSDGVRELRARLPAAFGPSAAKMIADADALREDAYRLSPRHGGADPDAPDFREEAEGVKAWLAIARPRADALTAPPGQR